MATLKVAFGPWLVSLERRGSGREWETGDAGREVADTGEKWRKSLRQKALTLTAC